MPLPPAQVKCLFADSAAARRAANVSLAAVPFRPFAVSAAHALVMQGEFARQAAHSKVRALLAHSPGARFCCRPVKLAAGRRSAASLGLLHNHAAGISPPLPAPAWRRRAGTGVALCPANPPDPPNSHPRCRQSAPT